MAAGWLDPPEGRVPFCLSDARVAVRPADQRGVGARQQQPEGPLRRRGGVAVRPERPAGGGGRGGVGGAGVGSRCGIWARP